MLARLRSVGRGRGFGVQSPTDYAFVRYVVCERWPYYAYGDLQAKHPRMRREERKLGELYLRLANHRQPSAIIDLAPTNSLYAEYFHAGCRRATIKHSLDGVGRVELLRIDVASPQLDEALGKAADGAIIIVEGINRSSGDRRRWREARTQAQVSYDLYWVGLLLFDSKRYHKDYSVNL